MGDFKGIEMVQQAWRTNETYITHIIFGNVCFLSC